ncbi:MAG: TIGR00282 family metallophosphoesterase [Clostridia bacterium]|nr:MAG: TIGR00282 family metallophosphoesterase [Clostridia bacterium]
MRIIAIGDIVGRPGRKAIGSLLPGLRTEYRPDLVIANAENAAGGNGLTREVADELFEAGIDVLTSGNHIWDKKEIYNFIGDRERLLRPANYPPDTPGHGFCLVPLVRGVKVAVINLAGRAFMPSLDCPFRTADSLVTALREQATAIVVDFHAEATAEKMALGWYLDGRVSAVYGTHTHIPTADARLLPKGTAYVTDIGMTGPRDSVLGIAVEPVIRKFITQLPAKFDVAPGPVVLQGVVIDIADNGQATSIAGMNLVMPG